MSCFGIILTCECKRIFEEHFMNTPTPDPILTDLLDAARKHVMTPEEREAQRQS